MHIEVRESVFPRSILIASVTMMALTCLPVFSMADAADQYPNKPIRMIVPFPPGGGTDIVARLLSRPIGEHVGQLLVVDNRPGAGGINGTDIAAKATPDGYTIVTVIMTHATNPALYPSLPFDAVKDFSAIGLITKNPQLLAVNSSLPVKSIADLIALARAKPGELILASGGNGTPSHFAGALLNATAGVQMLHVPYKGSAPAILDLLANRVTLNFSSLPALLNFVKSGKLRALAVTSLTRSALLSDVPTVSERGYAGFEVSAWQALLAPAGTPPLVIASLNRSARSALALTDIRERLATQGYEPAVSSPEEYNAYLRIEMAKWAKVVTSTGMKVQ